MSAKTFTLFYFFSLLAAFALGFDLIERTMIEGLPQSFAQIGDYSGARVLIWLALGGGAFQSVALWLLVLFGKIGADEKVLN